MKRIEWIDIARGLAMLMIVAGHTLFGFTFSPVARMIFAVHVPIFFVLSGYLFKERKWKVLFNKINHNLLLPYIGTCLIMVGISWFAIHDPRNWIFAATMETHQMVFAAMYGLGTPLALPPEMGAAGVTIPAIGAIWFLVAMYLGDLLFNLAFKVCGRFKNKLTFIWLLAISECVLGFYLGGILHLPLPWSLPAALVSQVFYAAGFTIKQFTLMDKSSLWAVGGTFLWAFSVHSGFFYLNTAYADRPLAAVLGGIGGSFAIMRFSKWLESLSAVQGGKLGMLETYGRLSLIVLCAHLCEAMLVRIAPALHQALLPLWGEFGATLAAIGYRVFFTVLALLLVPRIPLLRSFYLNQRFPFKLSVNRMHRDQN
ncbi:acyltransferase family protein [Liquorilactobacillus satsumensis]|uniref:acyltransferase family protein n=2 Tax=Liquorilactobacillus satsumensis TaxID=259059 RepID=UPI001E49236C|nr:acyltransferase [Liquorilactobacillus satsumensis]MCC7666391.1 acetyltransferase [Liquorilactobacillus satsumensis]MCP9313110.1 acyltransferase [Liquorilactobacillus satsumensis]MCP9328043.1 acyltransferase [Liquorilactobacillus satsumensis]MCP9358577.1 acyltransferase [Liquorilactobacillus satsumensis]MCP9359294.1 acyltransferase [Liquorilactobacillus satsumensis]